MELGLDKWAEVVGSSTVRWHSWEQYSDKGWNLIRLGVSWIHGGNILEIWGWILIRQNLGIWISGGSIVVVGMIGLWTIGLVRLWWRLGAVLGT